MDKVALVFNASRSGYTIGQVERGAMTVAELIGILEDYDEDDLIIVSHDKGYTYGTLDFLGEAYAYDGEEYERQFEYSDW